MTSRRLFLTMLGLAPIAATVPAVASTPTETLRRNIGESFRASDWNVDVRGPIGNSGPVGTPGERVEINPKKGSYRSARWYFDHDEGWGGLG